MCVFSPSPLLAVTIERVADDRPEVHVHAGGQGVWIGNMLTVLGARVELCAPVGGETGRALQAVLGEEMALHAVRTAGSNGCVIEDRRSGQVSCVADMPPAVLDRHETDELYNATVATALDSTVTVLSGPASDTVIDADVYRRLGKDLASLGVTTVADLSGPALEAAIAGSVQVLKVSHEELVQAGLAGSVAVSDLVTGMRRVADHGTTAVVVTRADEPALAWVAGDLLEVEVPALEQVDHRGAGDSVTAGLAAALAEGHDLKSALRWGMAAGAVNVTRRGLASGNPLTIQRLVERVTLRPLSLQRGDRG